MAKTFFETIGSILMKSPAKKSKQVSQRNRVRLGYEQLETREMMSGQTLFVTSSLDPPTLTAGTLRYEVNQANMDAANGNSDTIIFNTAQMGTSTVTLQQGVLELRAGTGTTTIAGDGTTIISGGGKSGVFEVDSGAQAVLETLTIDHGLAPSGAGINNSGTLFVYGATIANNTASSGAGGGIKNVGTLVLNDDFVTDNQVISADGGEGGGVYNSGAMAAILCSFGGNAASVNYGKDSVRRHAAEGGAIFSNGSLTVTQSSFNDNDANTGSAIFSNGALYISQSVFTDNSASTGDALFAEGTTVITGSTFSGNFDGNGVVIDGGGGELILEDTTIM